jgi:type I restriction enzyme S subunit
VYLDRWLQTMRETGEVWEYVNGTSVPNLNVNALLSGKHIVKPPETVMSQFFRLVRPVYHRLFLGESRTLAALRDTLLPKLISGELRIKDGEKTVERSV